MQINKSVSLKDYNTFNIDVKSDVFISVGSEDELIEIIKTKLFENEKFLILGDGSNILFTDDFHGSIIKNEIRGIETIFEDDENIYLKVGSGENWDELVEYTVNKGLYGIENLSLIPGTVGAAPIQNIGAYGVEIKDALEKVMFVNISDGSKNEFDNADCNFGYRNSIFKKELKGKVFITRVILKLSKKKNVNINYRALKEKLGDINEDALNSKMIRDAVCEIRNSKLPSTDVLGNAGSFFKNPIIEKSKLVELQKEFTEIPFYEIDEKTVKLPAGWLIENAELKGLKRGNVGTFEKQALVIVNFGNASGKEIKDFSIFVRREVKDKFGIDLEPEVNIV